MFYNVSSLSSNSKVKSLSIKKLYILYSFCKNLKTSNSYNKFLSFNVDLYFSLNTTNNTLRSLFLSLFFFSKTNNVLYLNKIDVHNLTQKKFNLFSTNLGVGTATDFFLFFKK